MDSNVNEVRPASSKATIAEVKTDADKPKNRLDDLILGPIELFSELPEGIIAIFLASSSQELFKLKGGEHVTAEKPLKFIPKSDILSDLYARAAVSDFSPYKLQINVFFILTCRNLLVKKFFCIMMRISNMDRIFLCV